MSFLFDDDNDDNVFSQTYQTSSQRQVTFSQSSSIFPSSQVSPGKQSSASQNPLFVSPFQSKQSQEPPSSLPAAEPEFVCRLCGSQEYYHDDAAGGVMTCSHCFTQSQTFGTFREELDFEDVHMAGRRKDGSMAISSSHSRAKGSAGFNADGTLKRGRPAVPLEDLDRTRKPPSLEECLGGFQTVLQKSCRIMCFDLIAIPRVRTEEANYWDVPHYDESDGNDDSSQDSNHPNSRLESRERRQKLYEQVSKNLKELWKAYLLSWKEGADFYSELYPQIRFSLRDSFLSPIHIKILKNTLAARAKDALTETIRKEIDEELSSDEDSVSSSDSSFVDPKDDASIHRENKKIKVEHNPTENKTIKVEPSSSDGQGMKTEMDVLFDLFQDKMLGSEKVKSEHNVVESDVVVKREDVPVLNIVLSDNSKTALHQNSSSVCRGDTHADSNISIDRVPNNRHERNETESVDTDDMHSVTSDLSVFDSAEIRSETKDARKRKRVAAKERIQAQSHHTFDQMFYYHKKLLRTNLKSKKRSMLGQKEAALMLRPSMRLLLGLLLVAASPHGVTEGQIVAWVENGSLPILDAFSTLLTEGQKESLAMVACFFTLPQAQKLLTAASLHRIAKKIHIACQYKLSVQPPSMFEKRQPVAMFNDEADFTPGRLVCRSAVPSILGQLVSDLGFSQRVLNYSLSLIGLPVSRQALTGVLASNKGQKNPRIINDRKHTEWLPPRLSQACPKMLGDIHQILAIITVACKMIPDWEKNHKYIFPAGQDFSNHLKSKDRFVPWNQEQFQYIRNGKIESAYLDFIEEYVLRGNNYTLPNFVESLKKSPTSQWCDDSVTSDVDPEDEESISHAANSDNGRNNDNPFVIPNELVLGWKYNSSKNQSSSERRAHGVNGGQRSKRSYRPTTATDTMDLMKTDDHLGPLIEYVATRTEACPTRILKHLVQFDKELVQHKSKTRRSKITFRRPSTPPTPTKMNDREESKAPFMKIKTKQFPPKKIKTGQSPVPSSTAKESLHKKAKNNCGNDSNWDFSDDEESNLQAVLIEPSPRTIECNRNCSNLDYDSDYNSIWDKDYDSSSEYAPSQSSSRIVENVPDSPKSPFAKKNRLTITVAPPSPPRQLSEYEKIRLRNIERNNARLAALGLMTPTTKTSHTQRSPPKPTKSRKADRKVQTLRRSTRNRPGTRNANESIKIE